MTEDTIALGDNLRRFFACLDRQVVIVNRHDAMFISLTLVSPDMSPKSVVWP